MGEAGDRVGSIGTDATSQGSLRASVVRQAYEALERFGAQMFRQSDAVFVRAWRGPFGRLLRWRTRSRAWPATPGAYAVGDTAGSIGVCVLTSQDLVRPIATLPRVAIAGRLITCNLGIEKIILNVCSSPCISTLFVCGMDSPVFRPSQSLRALFEHGVASDKRIVGATGYMPVLQGLTVDLIEEFRGRVTLVDRTGLEDLSAIERELAQLADRVAPAQSGATSRLPLVDDESRFKVLRPGGKRDSLAYDPKGYFVFTIDREKNDIAARHYSPEAVPAHVMRGRSGEGIALALIREGLITQMTHAAYVGAELAKAETALRTGMEYEQDQPLRVKTP
jgi:tetrahydromethanopterin S-methyltransferase subunit A